MPEAVNDRPTPETDAVDKLVIMGQGPIKCYAACATLARSLERRLGLAIDEIEHAIFTVGAGGTPEQALADAYDKIQLRLRALLPTLRGKP